MNKDKAKGFLCGVLLCVLTMALAGTALAAKMTIEIDNGIKITINGVPFLPKDAKGNTVPVFTYNGTTYVPLRAISEAAGFKVGYEGSSRTATLETPEYAAASDPRSSSFVTAAKAREVALADAGVAAQDALFLKTNLDWEDGRAVYKVEFCAGQMEYDYELDAISCHILHKDFDCDDFDWEHHNGSHHGGHGTPASQPSNLISADKARSIALTRLPGGTVRKCELGKDDGRWIYEIELWKDRQEYECEVDAATGTILKWERDD